MLKQSSARWERNIALISIDYLSITNPEKSNNEFGSSANITEENDSYAVIGAPGTDNEKGAIYIYEKNSTWDYLGKIQPTSLKEGTRFGTSVAIIETRNKDGVIEVTIAVSGMNNVYVFNDITKFVTPIP